MNNMILYKSVVRPLLFLLPPEVAHHAVMLSMRVLHRAGLLRLFTGNIGSAAGKDLACELFGLRFSNPIGLAAGFDKDAGFVHEFAALGFGFVEIGTVTPVAQSGNPLPRLFRLPPDRALVNRMGFNNGGADKARKRLAHRPKGIVVGGNIGKNRDTPLDLAASDYARCFEELFDYVDYFTVNLSSPNTPGLRSLQDKKPLEEILKSLQHINRSKLRPKPILLKIAPDLEQDQLDDIIGIALNTGIAGIVATNTTTSRAGLKSPPTLITRAGDGGLSGDPLRSTSTQVIRYIRQKAGPDFPIIGVGGIMSDTDALEKLEAGANLVQVYTGLVYSGPGLIRQIARALRARSREHSYKKQAGDLSQNIQDPT
jgi:dihydroorotate dehydrogenase